MDDSFVQKKNTRNMTSAVAIELRVYIFNFESFECPQRRTTSRVLLLVDRKVSFRTVNSNDRSQILIGAVVFDSNRSVSLHGVIMCVLVRVCVCARVSV